jgi:hypothetical protein
MREQTLLSDKFPAAQNALVESAGTAKLCD